MDKLFSAMKKVTSKKEKTVNRYNKEFVRLLNKPYALSKEDNETAIKIDCSTLHNSALHSNFEILKSVERPTVLEYV